MTVSPCEHPEASDTSQLPTSKNNGSRKSCTWVTDALLRDYHDNEWGREPQDDAQWLECVILETFQAGLSWKTILHKREAFRSAFAGFNMDRLGSYAEDDVMKLMGDTGIVRHRQKIEAAIANARIAQGLRQTCGSLTAFFADLADKSEAEIVQTLCRTFRFVGPTTAESICYASGLLQAPHDPQCWKAGS